MSEFVFFNPYITRSTRILRDGTRQRNARPKNVWGAIIRNHRKSAHGGNYDPSCYACIEMERKAREDAK